jgi:hypothetical protein
MPEWPLLAIGLSAVVPISIGGKSDVGEHFDSDRDRHLDGDDERLAVRDVTRG